jgi:hypothetical protein
MARLAALSTSLMERYHATQGLACSIPLCVISQILIVVMGAGIVMARTVMGLTCAAWHAIIILLILFFAAGIFVAQAVVALIPADAFVAFQKLAMARKWTLASSVTARILVVRYALMVAAH